MVQSKERGAKHENKRCEKLLGITKANIRFYEKEDLISPIRSENGYREYSESDISQLKEIIILRKLGIPVQQVADILDGALPLQDALDRSIQTLQAEIKKLNGSLQLCRQLKAEDARILDTEYYWELINKQEQQGLLFQSIAEDYVSFVGNDIHDAWFISESKKEQQNPCSSVHSFTRSLLGTDQRIAWAWILEKIRPLAVIGSCPAIHNGHFSDSFVYHKAQR